jgi:hypothetical protein
VGRRQVTGSDGRNSGMNYEHKLARLEHLRDLLDKYIPVMYSGSEEKTQLHQEICETYGEVADVFDEIIGKQGIEVPDVV